MEDKDLRTYNNYIKQFDPKGVFGRVEIYKVIIDTLEDFKLLKLSLGIYTDEFILKLKENIKTYENRVLEDIKNNDYSDVKKKAIFNTKQKAEALILSLGKDLSNIDDTNIPPKKSIEDFFANTSLEKIHELQEVFKGIKNKKLAILIHILRNEYKVIVTDSLDRKHSSPLFFTKAFNDDDTIGNIKGAGNYLLPDTVGLKLINEATDNDYISVKKKIVDVLGEISSIKSL